MSFSQSGFTRASDPIDCFSRAKLLIKLPNPRKSGPEYQDGSGQPANELDSSAGDVHAYPIGALADATRDQVRAAAIHLGKTKLQAVRRPGIIGVKKCENVSGACRDARVSSRSNPPICLLQDADERSRPLDGTKTGVGGTIVNNDYFVRRPRLGRYRRDRIRDESLCVVTGQYDTDPRARYH